MKEFLLLLRGGDGRQLQQSPEEWQQHMQRWADWMGNMAKAGKFVGAQPLSANGKMVSGTAKIVSDGPFMEGKEMVGGYLICKVDNYDEAVALAKGCPILEFENGAVEIREIQDMNMR